MLLISLLVCLLAVTTAVGPTGGTPARAQQQPSPSPAATAAPTPASTAADDPGVAEARAQLDQARARVEAATERLDSLAETLEASRAHAIRLEDELADADDRLDDAQDGVDRARAAHSLRVREAYMLPGIDLVRRTQAFLVAPDLNTALHASALMSQAASVSAGDVDAVLRDGMQVVTDVGNQRGIANGTQAAMADVAALSETFTGVLDAATADVAVAEDVLAQAVEDAEQRALLGQLSGPVGNIPPPDVRLATINGGTQPMACPLGQPNGFIDSWGFPRSGGRTHKGVDMFASYGMPIFAAADGYVRRVYNNRLGGLSIDLVDVLGNRYYYAHLSAAYVLDAQSVRAGELIAANGNSGNAIATPPHLHWQFHPADGGPVNPYPVAAALCR